MLKNEKNFSPEYQNLIAAISEGDQTLIRKIVKQNPGILSSQDGHCSALSYAIDTFSSEIIDLLISLGAKLDIWSAAAVGKTSELERIIVENPDLINEFMEDEGWAPAHCAIYFNNNQALKVLINHGANVELISDNEYAVSPLTLAIVSGKPDCVRTLINEGADPFIPYNPEYKGVNALHSAAYHGNEDIVKFLLDWGINPSQKDGEGKTPADYARDQGFDHIYRMLEFAQKKIRG